MTVTGRVGPPIFDHRPFISGAAERRLPGLAGLMFDHVETDKRFEHGHFDQLAFASALLVKKSRQSGVNNKLRPYFVANR